MDLDTLKLLSADDIIKADDLVYDYVAVPEWGGRVRVRCLTGSERDEFEDFIVVTKGQGKHITREAKMANARAKVCSLGIVGEDGARLFNNNQIILLGSKNSVPVQRVFEKIMQLSAMTEKEIEELGNDSVPGQSDGSTSS
jgi:hypothetical protein